jgi:hypothetical protein
MMADAENSSNWSRPELHHWAQNEWRRFIRSDTDPDLKYWEPGSALPEVHLLNHLAKPHIRLVQRLVHKFLLELLDNRRSSWPADGFPQRIPNAVEARLRSELQPVTGDAGVADFNSLH